MKIRPRRKRFSAGKRAVASNVVLGFRAHTGWAVLVAVAGPPAAPSVAYRCRIDLGGSDVPRFVYHAAQEAGLAKAPRIIRLAEARACAAATRATREAFAHVESQGYRVVAGAVLLGSTRVPPALDIILASHPLIHAAEGHLFRSALTAGCETCGIKVHGVPERELWTRAEQNLGLKRTALRKRLDELGRVAGRPWAQDQKLAALAAWLALPAPEPG